MRKTNRPARPPGGKRPEAGFSLIEVAVATSVLVIGLMGLGTAMIMGYRVEQATTERKIALNFISSQMERIRAMDYADIIDAPPTGYMVPSAWSSSSGVGYQKTLDGDADTDIFVRYYYGDQSIAPYVNGAYTVPLADANLNGLAAQSTGRPVGQVIFRDPDNTTGVTEGEGYWVTVKVNWKGVSGNTELKLSTFVTRK